MPRGYVRPASATGRVRAYFGIDQYEMALFLGVSDSMAGHFDTGRRPLDAQRLLRLGPFLQQIPVEMPEQFIDEAIVEAEPIPSAPPPLRQPLEARRAYCLSTARSLRRRLVPLIRKAQYLARWQAALPALLAAMPQLDPAINPVPVSDPADLFDEDWARHWLRKRTRPLKATEITQWHLLRTRAAALEAEAAALTVLLETLPST